MRQFTVNQIGKIIVNREGMYVHLEPEMIPALQALDGFSHINIFWWFDGCDNEKSRNVLTVPSPYKHAPHVMGTFATRSPERPNPVALTTARILHINQKDGIIQIDYTDANPGSPVLDLKPYTPSLDRVAEPDVPDWCGHWPKCVEESGGFDWENEFRFSQSSDI